MTSRSLRILLLFVAIGAVVAGSFVVFRAERALTASTASTAGFEAQARATGDELAALRAAQQAYVAEGQSSDFWMQQAGEHLARVDAGLAELADASSNDPTRASIQAAAASLEQFRKLDTRVRQYVENRQVLMASDVIFTESLSALTKASEQIGGAAETERAAGVVSISSLRSRQFYAAAGAAAALLLVILLLAPVPEPEVDVLTAMRALTESAPLRTLPGATPKPKAKAEPVAIAEEGSSARLLARQPVEPPAAQPAAPLPAPVAAEAVPPPVAPRVNLVEASRVCSDLARVLDAGDVQGLLARAAELLSARGVIVWVAGRQGASLYPMFTYGYPAAVLIRLGSISSDARNATAAAWRSGELTAVAGAGDRPGALVTPIVTADGCVGVLAAEIADGREMDGDVRALATIFSAQLATVVTPVAEVSQGDMADRVAT
jgi:hypothetical protein